MGAKGTINGAAYGAMIGTYYARKAISGYGSGMCDFSAFKGDGAYDTI